MRLPPTFGPTFKALRLQYRWSESHGAFIRITEIERGFVFELAPSNYIPNKSATLIKCKHHKLCFYWWDKPNILDMVKPLKMIKWCKKPFYFVVDEHGELI